MEAVKIMIYLLIYFSGCFIILAFIYISNRYRDLDLIDHLDLEDALGLSVSSWVLILSFVFVVLIKVFFSMAQYLINNSKYYNKLKQLYEG
jgi:hypothetical protein